MVVKDPRKRKGNEEYCEPCAGVLKAICEIVGDGEICELVPKYDEGTVTEEEVLKVLEAKKDKIKPHIEEIKKKAGLKG